jgi:hypothetical protein
MKILTNSGASQRTYKTSIVVSYDDPELLPDYMNESKTASPCLIVVLIC